MTDRIILALDMETADEAYNLAKVLNEKIKWYKIGAVLFTKYGPKLVESIKGTGGKVMLDLKYHDIPNTVEKACHNAAELGVDMLTIHLSGGSNMITAAKFGVEGYPTDILGISVLTSLNEDLLQEIGYKHHDTPYIIVDKLVAMGVKYGVDGIVCSAMETHGVREQHGGKIIIVNPGIRLPDDSKADQKRVTGPKEAFNAGASFIVVGRSIYQAEDPIEAVKKFEDAMKEATS